ncbi:winged helix-turn-helix transcriptional regulator [Candidatus Woesebacteria bacterium]|nr:winged helix-turn-helix transcriptional regulator [Candidatus Woesebacteria bacterium]
MIYSISDLELNTDTSEVFRGVKKISLTKQEFKLLQLLLKRMGTELSREEILSHLWHAETKMKTRIVDVYVGYLRRKIDKGCELKLIRTIRGMGYMISD